MSRKLVEINNTTIEFLAGEDGVEMNILHPTHPHNAPNLFSASDISCNELESLRDCLNELLYEVFRK